MRVSTIVMHDEMTKVQTLAQPIRPPASQTMVARLPRPTA